MSFWASLASPRGSFPSLNYKVALWQPCSLSSGQQSQVLEPVPRGQTPSVLTHGQPGLLPPGSMPGLGKQVPQR